MTHTRDRSIPDALRRVWWRVAAVLTAVGLVSVAHFGVAVGVLQPDRNDALHVRHGLYELRAGMLDQETGLRGYLLTGDTQFLTPYREGAATVDRARASLDRDGSPAVRAVVVAAEAWEQEWTVSALTRRATDRPDARFLGEGKRLFDAYRLADENASAQVSGRVDRSQRAETDLLALGIVLAVGAAAGALVLARRGFRNMRVSISTPVHDLLAAIDALDTGAELTPLRPGAARELHQLHQRLAQVGTRMSAAKRRTSALMHVHHTIASAGLDEQRVMELVTTQLRVLTGADAAVLELRDGATMVYAAADGTAADHIGRRLPVHGSASGHAATTGTSVRIDDAETAPHVDLEAARAVGARSMLVVPLRHDGSVIGVLKVYSDRPAMFTGEDEHTVELLSGLAAVTVHNGRTHAAAVADRLAAERSERRFRALFDRSPVGQVEFDLDGRILHVNEVFATMLGRTPADLVGAPPTELVHPGDSGPILAKLDRIRSGDTTHYTERRVYRHADGRAVVALVTGALVRDAAGGQHMIGTAVDVTESERTREALAESEQQLRRMFDAAPVGILVRDADGRIVRTNAAFAAMVGYTVDDLIGLRADLLTHPDDLAAARETFRRIATGEDDVALVEKRYRRIDGTPVWASATSTALEYDGRTTVLTYVADISERRAAADSLRHRALHDELTGLPNRAAAVDLLDDLRRDGRAATVLFIDLDGFKPINDEHGHHAGDAVLVEVGKRLAAAVRPGDVAARFAGDEFVLICPGLSDEDGAQALAARAEALVNAPIPVGGTTVRVGASIGIATAGPADDPGDLLGAADAAMYRTKRDRKQRGEVSPPTT